MPQREPSTIPDSELVADVKTAADDDTSAFEELVHRHQRHVMANCRHMTRASNDAEDLAQEVFVKAYFAIERFEGRASFRTWITQVKANHCLNYLRRQRGGSYVELDDRDDAPADPRLREEPAALRNLETQDERARVTAALDGLSDVLRVPLVLREIDGLSYDEIAQTLGVGLSAVKMRIKRARAQVRQALEAAAGDRPASSSANP